MRTLRVVTPRVEGANSRPDRPGHPAIRSLRRSLIAGVSVWCVLPTIFFLANPQSEFALIWAAATGVFVLPATLLVLWPMDGFLPRSSRFWHPGWMALWGLLSGTLFFAGGMGAHDPRGLLRVDLWLGSLVAGGTYGAAMTSVLGFLKRRS